MKTREVLYIVFLQVKNKSYTEESIESKGLPVKKTGFYTSAF